MRVFIFFFLFVFSAHLHANTNEQYYIELTNPKVVGDELAFDVRLFPKQENVIVIAGNIRYNFDKKILSSKVLPRLELSNENFEVDAVGFVGITYDAYVNLGFSSPLLNGFKLTKDGLLLGKVYHKMINSQLKDEKSLLLPRVFNVYGYTNPKPVTNKNNCTKIFTSDSPYEPVQEGLPVNKVHFYTEQIVGSDSSFEIYPNPSTGFLTYNWSGADSNKDVFVKIFDNTGKLLMSRSMNQQTEGSLDISDYTPGLYFLHFENGGITEKHKIIKVD
jgi:hypothetical protein